MWHHYTAADVCTFTVHRDKQLRWTVSAAIANGDDFKLAQSPLVLVVPTKFGAWHWPIVSAQRQGAYLLAQLGMPTRDRAGKLEAPAPAPTPAGIYDAYGQAYRQYRGVF